MIDAKAALLTAASYLRRHPEEGLRAIKGVALLRPGVPLDALRWFAAQPRGRRAPKDVEIAAVPPGLRLAATVEAMKTPIRFGATLYIDRILLSPVQMRLELRLANVSLAVLGEVESPVGALIKSGALDLSKPGNLVAFMPDRPPLLVDAADDRIVLDLMRHPKIGNNPAVARVLGLVTPLVGIRAIATDADHLDVFLRLIPDGLTSAAAALRAHL